MPDWTEIRAGDVIRVKGKYVFEPVVLEWDTPHTGFIRLEDQHGNVVVYGLDTPFEVVKFGPGGLVKTGADDRSSF